MSTASSRAYQESNGAELLKAAVEKLAGVKSHSLPGEDWAALCEQLRLQALHPGQYVAWRDHYRGAGAARRLIHREVLCASPHSAVVRKYLARLAENELIGVFRDYIEGPNETLSGR